MSPYHAQPPPPAAANPASPNFWDFNTPPLWPRGFDPRHGHLQDPAWPTPPDGWEWWVPSASAPEQAQQRLNRLTGYLRTVNASLSHTIATQGPKKALRSASDQARHLSSQIEQTKTELDAAVAYRAKHGEGLKQGIEDAGADWYLHRRNTLERPDEPRALLPGWLDGVRTLWVDVEAARARRNEVFGAHGRRWLASNADPNEPIAELGRRFEEWAQQVEAVFDAETDEEWADVAFLRRLPEWTAAAESRAQIEDALREPRRRFLPYAIGEWQQAASAGTLRDYWREVSDRFRTTFDSASEGISRYRYLHEANLRLRMVAIGAFTANDGNDSTRTAEPGLFDIVTPQDAELAMVAWMRWLGFTDARRNPLGQNGGSDGGFDILATHGLGEVKYRKGPTGRPLLQQLHGAAAAQGLRSVYFSHGGYASTAPEYADQDAVAMALFSFTDNGVIAPVNAHAQRLYAAAQQRDRYADDLPPSVSTD